MKKIFMLLCASIAITSVSLANNNADEMERNTKSTVFTVLKDDEGQLLGPVTLCDKDGNTCLTDYSAYRSYTKKDTNGNGRIYVRNRTYIYYADPITNNPNFNYRVWISDKWYYFYI